MQLRQTKAMSVINDHLCCIDHIDSNFNNSRTDQNLNVIVLKLMHDHFFFFNAPAAILVTAEKSGMDLFGTDINGGLASAYMEIAAESMGLGVLYSGFTVINARLNKKVKRILNLSKKEQPVACLVLGYPDIHFKRIPPRKPAKFKILR